RPLPSPAPIPYTTLFRSLGPARLRVLVLLQHHDAGSLAHDEAGVAAVIGARGLLRRVVVGGAQRLAGEEAGDADGHDRALGPARDRKSTRLNSSHVKISC